MLWVNDGLMALFFFLVGLEIKREDLVGRLYSPRDAALAVSAALGRMINRTIRGVRSQPIHHLGDITRPLVGKGPESAIEEQPSLYVGVAEKTSSRQFVDRGSGAAPTFALWVLTL